MKTKFKTIPIHVIVGCSPIGVFWPSAVPQCHGQTGVPYVPQPSYVSISLKTNTEEVVGRVNVNLPDTCHYVGDWGQAFRVGNSFQVDGQFWRATNLGCFFVIVPVSTQYNLGALAPGNYDFIFSAWGSPVKAERFSVPVFLAVRPAQAASQVQLCWNTATNAWYRLEQCSTLAANVWTALTAWLPGTGNRFCTNDAVYGGQAQRFYR